ncbi:Uncharacterised protein [uncultured archaeon]|nr:Uncharacterised protein [uncultured archaeon]
MANMTLAIPDALYSRMQRCTELKWSEVARKAFREKMEEMELLDDLRAIRKAEKERREGKTTSYAEMGKLIKAKTK